jgi:hypothetical protein
LDVVNVDCAPRLLSSACKKACSDADEALLDVPVEVDPLPVLLLAVVDPVVVEPAAVEPVAADVVAVEVAPVAVAPVPAEVEDVDVELVGPVNAATSAWKSCCSFASALSLESDDVPVDDPDDDADGVLEDDPDDELDRLCSRFWMPFSKVL